MSQTSRTTGRPTRRSCRTINSGWRCSGCSQGGRIVPKPRRGIWGRPAAGRRHPQARTRSIGIEVGRSQPVPLGGQMGRRSQSGPLTQTAAFRLTYKSPSLRRLHITPPSLRDFKSNGRATFVKHRTDYFVLGGFWPVCDLPEPAIRNAPRGRCVIGSGCRSKTDSPPTSPPKHRWGKALRAFRVCIAGVFAAKSAQICPDDLPHVCDSPHIGRAPS